jgi:hypothetical protein
MVSAWSRAAARCVGLLTAVGLAISLTACGSESVTTASPTDGAAGDPAMNVTARSPHADVPTYASCQDLSKVFNSRVENQLSYLPEEHWLIVSPSSTAYKIDLVDDSACIAANPALARFVAQFEASQEAEQRGECHATLEQLAAGTFTVGNKTADPEALRDYAVSLCEPLGIAVPESPANSRSRVGPNGMGPYPENRADSPRLEVLASRDTMWAFRFDWSGRPTIVDSVALMRTDQNCTTL